MCVARTLPKVDGVKVGSRRPRTRPSEKKALAEPQNPDKEKKGAAKKGTKDPQDKAPGKKPGQAPAEKQVEPASPKN